MEQASPGQTRVFQQSKVTAFRELVDSLVPACTGAKLAACLGHRAKRTTALQWYAGRRNPPQWAVDILHAKLRERHDNALYTLSRIKTRSEQHPGPRNLAKWKAENPR